MRWLSPSAGVKLSVKLLKNLVQVAQRKELMLRQFGTLKEVSSATGVTVDQILLSQQIANMADSGRYQMRGEPG